MPDEISNNKMAEKITRYFTLQRTALKSLIKSGEMPYAHYNILSMLNERGQMRMGEISEVMAISRPNLTPLVDRLVALNYVERISYAHDRRVTYLGISDIGRQVLEKEHKTVVEGISSFTSKLNDEERDKFVDALDTMTEMFTRI